MASDDETVDLRCFDCWRRRSDGVRLEKYKTYKQFPYTQGKGYQMAFCGECWERRVKYAPDYSPPRNPSLNYHEPTKEREHCVECGTAALTATGTIGDNFHGGAVEYTCRECRYVTDDAELEDYDWNPPIDAPNEGVRCIICREHGYEATGRIERDSGDRIYECPGCGYTEAAS